MKKFIQIQSNIEIQVKTAFNPEVSIIESNRFFYNYHITIANNNSFSIKLLSRTWEIFDSLHAIRKIQGDGVVGLQPTIYPNDKFSYRSGCDLYSEIGSMRGSYTFERLDTHELFDLPIPEFSLIYFAKLN
jgi:ApaG protein